MELALASGTGVRFNSDLENGKPTWGKAFNVLRSLGIEPVPKVRVQSEAPPVLKCPQSEALANTWILCGRIRSCANTQRNAADSFAGEAA